MAGIKALYGEYSNVLREMDSVTSLSISRLANIIGNKILTAGTGGTYPFQLGTTSTVTDYDRNVGTINNTMYDANNDEYYTLSQRTLVQRWDAPTGSVDPTVRPLMWDNTAKALVEMSNDDLQDLCAVIGSTIAEHHAGLVLMTDDGSPQVYSNIQWTDLHIDATDTNVNTQSPNVTYEFWERQNNTSESDSYLPNKLTETAGTIQRFSREEVRGLHKLVWKWMYDNGVGQYTVTTSSTPPSGGSWKNCGEFEDTRVPNTETSYVGSYNVTTNYTVYADYAGAPTSGTTYQSKINYRKTVGYVINYGTYYQFKNYSQFAQYTQFTNYRGTVNYTGAYTVDVNYVGMGTYSTPVVHQTYYLWRKIGI